MQFSITLLALVSAVFSRELGPAAIFCGCTTVDAVQTWTSCYCDGEALKLSSCLTTSWPTDAHANERDQIKLDECLASSGAQGKPIDSLTSATSTAVTVSTTLTVPSTSTASYQAKSSTTAAGYVEITSTTKAVTTVAPTDECTTTTALAYGTHPAAYNSASTFAVGALVAAVGLMLVIYLLPIVSLIKEQKSRSSLWIP